MLLYIPGVQQWMMTVLKLFWNIYCTCFYFFSNSTQFRSCEFDFKILSSIDDEPKFLGNIIFSVDAILHKWLYKSTQLPNLEHWRPICHSRICWKFSQDQRLVWHAKQDFWALFYLLKPTITTLNTWLSYRTFCYLISS